MAIGMCPSVVLNEAPTYEAPGPFSGASLLPSLEVAVLLWCYWLCASLRERAEFCEGQVDGTLINTRHFAVLV